MSVIRSQLLILAAALAAPALADGPAETATPTATETATAPSADIENGKTIVAQRCVACHAVNKDPGGPIAGPNLVGLIGRKAASQPDFTMYTPAMKAYDVVWTEKTLDEFLISPLTKVPNTLMPIALADKKERDDVIAYLATLK